MHRASGFRSFSVLEVRILLPTAWTWLLKMAADGIRVVAIGGGGCTNHSDPDLDSWILSLFEGARPVVGYLGTASRSDPLKLEGLLMAYAGKATLAEPLGPDACPHTCAEWLQRLDLLYVGGGDTKLLLDEWRRLGWCKPLQAAARQGVMLAGVSAGAMCWFDEAFSSADGSGFRALPGLGLIRGSCCPHYSDEPQRRPAFEHAVASGAALEGLAIDDGVGVLCDENGPIACFAARAGNGAYRIRQGDGQTLTTPVPLLSSLR